MILEKDKSVRVKVGSFDIMIEYSNYDQRMYERDGQTGILEEIIDRPEATSWYGIRFPDDDLWWYAAECLEDI